MMRSTQDEKEGKIRQQSTLANPLSQEQLHKGLEALGKQKRNQIDMESKAAGETIRPGLRQLRPEDLPEGVTAAAGYDHRGMCYVFSHRELGQLGRIVMIPHGSGQMLMQSEVTTNQQPMDSPAVIQRKELMEAISAAISSCFDGV